MKTWLGDPCPLGATLRPEGVNFALFTEHATAVDLCLFEGPGGITETGRIRMTEHTDHVWHCFVPGLRAGQLYGYRVNGPYAPLEGHRFNGSKLLLDPYARAVTGLVQWAPEMFAYAMGAAGEKSDLIRDYRDNSPCMPRCVVVDEEFDWGQHRAPGTPMAASVIYEVHVKGFSKLCERLPVNLRGTYAGMGSEFALEYFKGLGITAVELMPIHHFVNDEFLVQKGLSNYWGYNSIGYFAPHAEYSGSGTHGQQVAEFKGMVKNLHAAGIEVILDVVYNHTGEGNHMGPMLSLRGLDNRAYYRLVKHHPRFYMDYTGTGNTLNMMHPRVLQLIMDSLRYWVQVMHVDGFRFDLAATLGREAHEVSRVAAFFDIIHQDPVLSRVKLIAEPWDVGEGGYQVGNFPVLWAEWNGRYRDSMRSHWRGERGTLGEFAYRLTGSSDLYQRDGRRPYASINLITAHDGFTLLDLVSYETKHNESNGESNRDGHNDNRSWNCGIEGLTDDEAICRLRRRQMRNLLVSLFLSQGVPMLCGGDEFARTQMGNNNAYCQDNEISWFNWQWDDHQHRQHDFTTRLVLFRHEHPVFRRPKFLQGRRIRGTESKDVMWLDRHGAEMSDQDWISPQGSSMAVLLSGNTRDVRDHLGCLIKDDTFLLLLNPSPSPATFKLAGRKPVNWELLVDTNLETGFLEQPLDRASGSALEVEAWATCVLRLKAGTDEQAHAARWKQRRRPAVPPLPDRVDTHRPVDP